VLFLTERGWDVDVLESFSMLGIREKDVRRCRGVLKSKFLKMIGESSGIIVNEFEIWSPAKYNEGEDHPEGSCYVEWDVQFSP
jgi:hypothetical protein